MGNQYTNYEIFLDNMFSSAKSEFQREAKEQVENMRKETRQIVDKIRQDAAKQVENAKKEVSAAEARIEKMKAEAAAADKDWQRKMKESAANFTKEMAQMKNDHNANLDRQKVHYQDLLKEKDAIINSEKENASKILSEEKKNATDKRKAVSEQHKKETEELNHKIEHLHNHYKGIIQNMEAESNKARSMALETIAKEKSKSKEIADTEITSLKKQLEDKNKQMETIRQDALKTISEEQEKCYKMIAEAQRKAKQSLEEKDRMHDEYVATAEQIITQLQSYNSSLNSSLNTAFSNLSFFQKLKLLFK